MLPDIPLTVWPSRRPFQVWSALKSIVSTPCHLFIIERLYIGHMDGGSQQLLQHNICSRFKVLCSQSSEYYVPFTIYIYMYGQHFQQSTIVVYMDQPRKVAIPARGRLNRKDVFFLPGAAVRA